MSLPQLAPEINSPPIAPDAHHWAAYSNELAEFTLERMVNRRDVWGGFWVDVDGTIQRTTCPQKDGRGRRSLTLHDLKRHFGSTSARGLVGLHTTSESNSCLWCAIDIDNHGSRVDSGANELASIGWVGTLFDYDLPPESVLLTTSNGNGGYHLRVLFRDPIPSEEAHTLARWLTRDFRKFGLTASPEIFPKQARIEPHQFGNWLRLPGHHHSRDIWSTAWDGERWLAGEAGIRYILSRRGATESQLRPLLGCARDWRVAHRIVYPTPHRTNPAKSQSQGQLTARIRCYVAKCPNLSTGQGRDDVAYRLAGFLTRDMSLSASEALPWLESWDYRNDPPKGTDRLAQIIENVLVYGRNPIGGAM